MKKLLTILALLTLLTIPTSQATSFPDIRSPQLQEAVEYLSDEGIIQGYPDGTFQPDNTINRAEALKIIFESRGIAVENAVHSGFPDVPTGEWYAKHITQAKKLGIIQGYPDGYYRPGQEVNKVEFIKIAMLAQAYYDSNVSHSQATNQFSDLENDSWYVPYLAFAIDLDFLDDSSRYYPTSGMSRGEAALIIYRIAQHNASLASIQQEKMPSLIVDDPPERYTLSDDPDCDSCINGIDVSDFTWSTYDYIDVSNGKIIIEGSDYTADVGPNQHPNNILQIVEREALERVPLYTKNQVDVLFPDLYDRAIKISGGGQDEDSYITYIHPHYPDDYPQFTIVDRNGEPIKDCDCQFEQNIVGIYNKRWKSEFPNNIKTPFEDWIGTTDAKQVIYDVIYYYLQD